MIESAEMKKAVNALESAIIVLRDATGFLQQGVGGGAHLNRVLTSVQEALTKAPSRALLRLVESSGGKSKLTTLRSFTEQLAKGSRMQYTPQSSTVQGILKDMYFNFATDLEAMDSA